LQGITKQGLWYIPVAYGDLFIDFYSSGKLREILKTISPTAYGP